MRVIGELMTSHKKIFLCIEIKKVQKKKQNGNKL